MAALHDALKSLATTDFSSLPIDDLKSYLSSSFHRAHIIVDSVPPPPSIADTVIPSTRRERSDTSISTASNASEISISSARSDPPPPEIEALQREWGKPIKLSSKDNPLGMTVYKTSGKDGKGSWFARRSVHEGLSFSKWKKGLQNEFPETLKVQGNPGEGNIRGIGGERRVEKYEVENTGKLEVYHLHAQFPGPTTPRDFVELILTSDAALSEWSDEDSNSISDTKAPPQHFMVISKPCIHPECPPRAGFVRGQYESVEFIREVPLVRRPRKSVSATHLPLQHNRERSSSSALSKEAILRNAKKAPNPLDAESVDTGLDGSKVSRLRGKTISFAESRGVDAKGESFDVPRDEEDECDSNPVEWIMITRSDPGGGIPRWMVERGTPSSIVADASKFLDWACATKLEDMENEGKDDASANASLDENNHSSHRLHAHSRDLHDYETNGHMAGMDGAEGTTPAQPDSAIQPGLYEAVTGMVGIAGSVVAAHAPTMIANYLPGHNSSDQTQIEPPRRPSLASAISSATVDSFVSAPEGTENDSSDMISVETGTPEPSSIYGRDSRQEKELQKLEERKRKLAEKLAKTREREFSKKSGDVEKEQSALAKAEEKHQREIAKQEEKYRKEVAKLEDRKRREALKTEEKRRKAGDKDEKTRMGRELEETKAEADVLKAEKELLQIQVGQLQAQNTALTAKLGRLGAVGEEILRDVREEVLSSPGRARGSSTISSTTSLEKQKD